MRAETGRAMAASDEAAEARSDGERALVAAVADAVARSEAAALGAAQVSARVEGAAGSAFAAVASLELRVKGIEATMNALAARRAPAEIEATKGENGKWTARIVRREGA